MPCGCGNGFYFYIEYEWSGICEFMITDRALFLWTWCSSALCKTQCFPKHLISCSSPSSDVGFIFSLPSTHLLSFWSIFGLFEEIWLPLLTPRQGSLGGSKTVPSNSCSEACSPVSPFGSKSNSDWQLSWFCSGCFWFLMSSCLRHTLLHLKYTNSLTSAARSLCSRSSSFTSWL